MAAFEVLPYDVLRADATLAVDVRYQPDGPGDVALSFHTTGEVQVADVRFALPDGTTLAARSLRTDEHGVFFELGWLESAVVVSVAMRPVVPVVLGAGIVYVVANGIGQVEIPVTVSGEPRFVAARSRAKLSVGELSAGEWCECEIALVNDGTATASDVRAHIELPKWVSAESHDSWREIGEGSARTVVVPVGKIDVGERVLRSLRLGLASAMVNGTELTFGVDVLAGDATFALESVRLVVQSGARLAFDAHLVQGRAFRHADGVAAIVHVRNDGTDVARDVQVLVGGTPVRWIGDTDEAASLVVRVGDIPPKTDVARLIEGLFTATPSGDRSYEVDVTAVVGEQRVAAQPLLIDGTGRSRVLSSVDVSTANEGNAHRVRLALRNVGDGEAAVVKVRWHGYDGVVGVVDSLLIDDAKCFGLDGSLPVERGGVSLGAMPIRSSRVIEWLVRSVRDQAAVIALDVIVDGVVDVVESEFIALVCGVREDSLPPAVSDASPESVVTSFAERARAGDGAAPIVAIATSSETAQPVAALAEPEASVVVANESSDADNQAAAAADNASVEAIHGTLAETETETEATELEGAPAPHGVRFALGDREIARWNGWFGGEASEAAELGRYVLFAREFLPVAAAGDLNALMMDLRAQSDAVVTARLMSFKTTNVFGASGYDFGNPKLRAAVADVWKALGRERDGDLVGAQLDQAIVGLTSGTGTVLEKELYAFREALLDALEDVQDVEVYGRPAPHVLRDAANALYQAMNTLPVAA